MPQPHPHHQAHLVAAVAVAAFAATLGFHFLLAPSGRGAGFVLFAVLLVAAMVFLAVMTAKPANVWAAVFLVPAAFSVVAEALYASAVVAALGFLITFVSLAFFAYWVTVPRVRFDEVRSLWPWQMVPEVVFPVRGLSDLLSGRAGKWRWAQIGAGVILAVPVLVVIGSLFAGADPLFRHGIEQIFDSEILMRTVWKICRDVVVLLFFLGGGWLLLTRAIEGRRPKTGAADVASLDRTLVMTFLGLVNALFAVFLVFQAIYFFGGEEIVRSSGLTYAAYAREGFFQLLAVAGIVFGLIWLLYRMTELREWGTRGLSLLLIVQTGVIIVSAVKRLLLYIEAYGLTVSRYWAMAVILLIAAVLLACLVGALAKIRYHELAKYAFPGVLIVVSSLLLFNVEGFVTRTNVSRFLQGKTTKLDLEYMLRLSSDAVPALVDLTQSPWPIDRPEGAANTASMFLGSRPTCDGKASTYISAYPDGLTYLLTCPKNNRWDLDTLDWRQKTLSSYRAGAAIAELQ